MAKRQRDFEIIWKDRLKRRVKRLNRILNSPKTPAWMIAEDVNLVAVAGLCYCGPLFMEKFGVSLFGSLRLSQGFCVTCEGNPNPISPGEVMCKTCIARVDKFEKEYLG